MFEQMILAEARGKKWTMLVALAGQVALIGALVLIPMLTLQQLPLPELSTVLVAPPPDPPPPPPPAPAATAPRVTPVVVRHFDANQLFTPKTVPKTVAVLPDLPAAPAEAPALAGVPGGVAGGQIGGVVGGVLGGVIGGVPSAVPPPPPPPAKAPEPVTPQVIRVGGQVEAAKVISAPPPVYPVLAKDARVGGTVQLDATIGEDGHIENLKLLSGPPLLVEAAMQAVKQWTYSPTILNGKPVKVRTQVMVNFQLS
jgi:protein TonB